jgi:hypothetical protein
MTDLRDHLFATLESLRDEEKPMDIERAKAISSVAGKLIDSAKVEVKFLEVAGKSNAGDFFEPRRLEGGPPASSRPNGRMREAGNA